MGRSTGPATVLHPPLGNRRLFRPGWIVFVLFVMYPLFWLLGAAEFVWPLAAIPLAVWALTRHHLERPPAVLVFGMYVAWSLFSIVRIDSSMRLILFFIRYGVYVTALGLAYFVYNERRVRRSTFVNWVAMLWVWAIIGGYLGLLIPRGRLNTTVTSLLLPRTIADNEFVGNLVRPRFAQVQTYLGVDIPRPSTLWAYTNEWGGNVGLLTPFFVVATLYSAARWKRWAGVMGLLASLPPVILSVNRGLWLSVGTVIIFVAVRSALAGRLNPLKVLAAALVVLTAVVALTPLKEIVSTRLEESSAGARSRIYEEAWEGAKQSPILGWGGPRPSSGAFAPAVGTHGHIWYAMFSHGFIAALLYVCWIIGAMYRAGRRSDPVSIMLTSVVFVGALQMFFYNMFSGSLPIMLIAVGLIFRKDADAVSAPRRSNGTVLGSRAPSTLLS